MTGFERVLVSGIMGILIGSGVLILGLSIMKRKPVLVSYKSIKAALPLVLLPLLIIGTFLIIKECDKSTRDIAYLNLLLWLILIILVVCALWVLLIPRILVLYNVTEALVLNCLDLVLQKHDIKYVTTESNNSINRAVMLSRVKVMLPELGTFVKVTFSPLGGACLWFRDWRDVASRENIVSDFTNALDAYQCDDSMMIGFQFTIIGCGAIALAGYALFDVVL